MNRFDKIKRLTFIILVITALCALLSGCNILRGFLNRDSKFAINATNLVLQVGETYNVELASGSVKENFKLVSSDDTKVEVVGDTKLLGKAKTSGSVSVTATSDSGKTAVISVTVNYADLGTLSIEVTGGNAIQLLEVADSAAPVTFSAVTNVGVDPNTPCAWTVKDDGGSEVATGSGKTFTFTPTVRNVTYTVYASSSGHNAEIKCGAFNTVYIEADKSKYKVGSDVEIDVSFLLPDNYSSSTVSLTVYVDDVSKGAQVVAYTGSGNVRHAKITVNALDSIGSYDIHVSFQSKVSNTVTVEAANFAAADHLDISVTSGSLTQTAMASSVTFAAALDPVNANADDVQWYVNDAKQSKTGATFTFMPNSSYGEYHVKAVIDAVESGYLTIVYLTQSDRNSLSAYLTESTKYGGYPQNYYISNQRELNNIIVYTVETLAHGDEDDPLKLFIDFNYGAEISDAIDIARMSSAEAGIIPGYTNSIDSAGEKLSITFDYKISGGQQVVNSPTADAEDVSNSSVNPPQSAESPSHYPKKSAAATRNFYIDSRPDTMLVTTSNMLYKVVSWGYRPVFNNDTQGIKLAQMYANAKDVLAKIITDDMSESEKVHAINDWIIYCVRYDYDLSGYQSSETNSNVDLNNRMKFYGYYLEGIFLNNYYNTNDSHAVCDGKSKAFVLLCGIEGINCERVSGYGATGDWIEIAKTSVNTFKDSYYIFKQVTTDYGYKYVKYKNDETYAPDNCYINRKNNSNAAGGHAWNKVLLDVDDNGYKEWFIIDTTWGDKIISSVEYLSHSYYLMTNADIADTHVESEFHEYNVADTEYDYYANETFTYGATTYDYVVDEGTLLNTSAAQLETIIKYEYGRGNKYVEFKVDYKITEEELQTLISSAISRATGVPQSGATYGEIRGNGTYSIVWLLLK